MAATPESLDGGAAEIDDEQRRRDEDLYDLCLDGRELPVLEALRAGASPNAASARDGDFTVLHSACRLGSVAIARALLEAGAFIDAKDISGSTPLNVACYFNNQNVMRVLLEAGAAVQIPDDHGRTPLHNVAGIRGDDQGRTRMLLKYGAPLLVMDRKNLTPRGVARFRNNSVATLIIEVEGFWRRKQWRAMKLKWRCWLVAMREELDVEAFLPPVVIRLSRAWAAENPWALLEDPALY